MVLAQPCCGVSAPVRCSPVLAASWSSTAHVLLGSGTQTLVYYHLKCYLLEVNGTCSTGLLLFRLTVTWLTP